MSSLIDKFLFSCIQCYYYITALEPGFFYFFLISILTILSSFRPISRVYVLTVALLSGTFEYLVRYHRDVLNVQPHHSKPLRDYARVITIGFSVIVFLFAFIFGEKAEDSKKEKKKEGPKEYKLRVFRGPKGEPVKKVENMYAKELEQMAKEKNMKITDEKFAQMMDEKDTLKELRKEFDFPKGKELYFTGNSLGLRPKNAVKIMNEEMEKWAKHAVSGHFIAPRPWFEIEDFVIYKLAKVVGAKPVEVAVMNSLTTNLHLLMVAFYRPNPQRYKILFEESPFPSDMYALISQVKYHGYDPEQALIQVGPREGEHYIRTEDILSIIEKEGDSIAVILFSGVHFLSGQAFDMEKITKAGHAKGCYVGFDLAHAVGNLHLKLHDWNVDFACWCSYKYMNAGPGAIAGIFVHEKFAYEDLPKFEGWWGHRRDTRFQMKTEFEPQKGAAVFQLSNPSIFAIAPLIASLDVFDKTSMEALRKKSVYLTAYFEILLKQLLKDKITILTPEDPEQRGCQLSIRMKKDASQVEKQLEKLGVIVDKRDPDVIRAAPVPLYNSYNDVYRFVHILKKVLEE